MKSYVHIPSRPKTAQPQDLETLAESIKHPSVLRSGITTTKDGEWGVLIVVKDGTRLPIASLNKKVGKYPVVYQEDSGKAFIARPAFPKSGE